MRTMKLYSNELLFLLSLLASNPQLEHWRVLWGDTLESRVDVIGQTITDETSVVEEIQSRVDVLSPTLLDSTDIIGGDHIDISTSGNYRLRTDVSASIRILASNVDLDLNHRVVTGGIFTGTSGTQQYITIHDGILLPPASTFFSNLYAAWAFNQWRFITYRNLIIVCSDATTNAVGRSGMWVDSTNCRIENCLIISASALAGGGAAGGDGIVLRLNTSDHPLIENTMIITGDGGSSAASNGGNGGSGIKVSAGSYAVIKNCQVLSTGDGGDAPSATPGNGGNGIYINSANATNAFIIDCILKNAGTGSSDGAGVNDITTSAVKNYVIRSRAHNNPTLNFSLQNSGVENGVALTYPPDSTAVNAYADVYVS